MPTFEHVRSIVIAKPAAPIHAIVDDLHAWPKWSPWEELDPNLTRTYEGAAKGVGARYAWVGKKSGEGSMVITESTPDRIALDLDFVKPFKANNKVVFRFVPEGSGTQMSWSMSGTRNLLLALMGMIAFDSMIVKDFDRGLAKLKLIVES